MRSRTALILDDEPLFRELMTEVLSEKGYTVSAFSDPLSCLSNTSGHCCMSTRPCVDVVLTDNQMPGMSGLEFLSYLKAKGCKLPDYRKAVISGNWNQEQILLAQQLGCRIFHKPTSIKDIFSWLDGCDADTDY